MKKIVALLSGGIDSPVATYLVIKQGYEAILVHAYGCKQQKNLGIGAKILNLNRQLGKFQKTKLYLIPAFHIKNELVKSVPEKLRMIIYRRILFRIADKIFKN